MISTELSLQPDKIGQYRIEKHLGRGNQADVYSAINIDTHERVAIKVLSKSTLNSHPRLKQLFLAETSILHSIKHPNILHMHEMLESDNNYYLVVDYCNQGDFEEYLISREKRHLPEAEAIEILKQIANAFQELHKRKILHRDFKLANIFLHNDNIKIGDFGLAKTGVDTAMSHLGTPLTMAFEILTMNKYVDSKGYSAKADLWSVGVVYYRLLFGDYPFSGLSIPMLIKDIRAKVDKGLSFPKTVSNESMDLLKGILKPDPQKRMTWHEFFNHPLFQTPMAHRRGSHLLELGNKNATIQEKIEREFSLNMSKDNKDTDFSFLDIDELIEDTKKGSYEASDIVEELLDEKQQRAIDIRLQFTEITFRYNHESNKVQFMYQTVKRIQKMFIRYSSLPYLMEGVGNTVWSALLDIMLLVLTKAHALNTRILNQYKRCENVFGFPITVFSEFVRSEAYKQVLANFNRNFEYLNEALTCVTEEIISLGKDLDTLQWCKDTEINANELKTRLMAKYELCKGLMTYPNDSHEWVLILAWIKICIDSSKNLPFYVDSASDQAKFDWSDFYRRIQKQQMIQAIIAEL